MFVSFKIFKPIFLALSIFVGGYALESACTSPNMNKLCTTEKIVDHCYSCRHNDVNMIEHCVPIFHNHLGALDNFPSKTWNCTLYRPSENTEDDNQVESDQQIIDNICEIDNFIYDMCHQQDNNGFCMIASFIHDMCERGSELDEESGFGIKNYQVSEHKFETLGCGSEKLKCMIKKSCRNLIKQFNDCDKDISCIYSLIIQNSSDENFQNLVKCIVPSN